MQRPLVWEVNGLVAWLQASLGPCALQKHAFDETKQRSSTAEPHEVVLEPLSISLSELILFRWSPTLGIHASDTSPRWTRKTDRET